VSVTVLAQVGKYAGAPAAVHVWRHYLVLYVG